MTLLAHSNRRSAALFGGVMLVVGLAPAQEPASSPVDTLTRLQDALVEMASLEGGQEARVARVKPEVERSHDFAYIAQELAGEWWAELTSEQRQQLSRSLSDLAAATYAGRLGELPGLRYEGTGDPSTESGVVQTYSWTSKGKEEPLATLGFVLLRADEAWRIVNVLFDGRDGLALERERWRGFLEARDLPGLIAALDAEAASYGATPTQVVARLQDALLNAMKTAKQRPFEQRFARLAPTVEATHDLEGIAKLTVSRDWKQLSEAQQTEFLATFRELTLATYAGRFDGFSGESFVREGEKEVRDAVQVVSRLVRPKKDPIRFEYLLRRSGGRWRILNIVVDGVSDLATKRSEYKTVLERDGHAGLIAKLRKQVQDQAAGGDGE